MAVHFLSILNITALRSVFAMLTHSLWIGALMALAAGLIMILTKASGSLLRYKLLSGLLILFALCMGYVFYNAIAGNAETLTADNAVVATDKTEVLKLENTQQQKNLFNALLSFIETHADTIVSIWFIVICFKCARLISGLRALHRLKKTNILNAGNHWIGRMNELAATIGIAKQVTLLQSSLAKIPMVLGHLKPIILFPIGILNALSPDEVEAILLHELAHIKRNDFLINLLQQFVEIFFFFNPGVLWVSSLIKNERENCCDDIAIAVTRDKRIFINALLAFQEYNAGLAYATTFPGSKNHLLNRVKRIITNNNKTLNNMEKLILASGIIVTGLVALAFTPDNSKKATVKKTHAIALATRAGNTTGKQKQPVGNINPVWPKFNYSNKELFQKETESDTSKVRYSGVIDGKKIQLTEEDGKVKELYVDGKKIPEDQYDKYTAIIEKIHQDMKENTDKLKIESDLLEQEKAEMEQQETADMKDAKEMKEQSELVEQDFSKQNEHLKKEEHEMQKEMKLLREKDEKMMRAKAEKDAAYEQRRQPEMQKEMKRMQEKNEAMMKEQSLKMRADFVKQQKQFQLKQVELQKQIQKMKLQQEKFDEIMRDSVRAKRITRVRPAVYSSPEISVKPVAVVKSQISAKPQVSVRSVASVMPAVKVVPSAGAISVGVTPVAAITSVVAVNPPLTVTSNSISNEIINDLEKADIISTRNNLSFRITNDELIVNGVKQSDALHQSILKKYVKKPGDNLSLTYNNRQ